MTLSASASVAHDTAPVARESNLISVVRTTPGSQDKAVEKPAVALPDADVPFAHLDHAAHAAIARLTGGLSPAALALAFFDWSVHLAASPGKQLSLAGEIIEDAFRFFGTATHFTPTFQPWSLI